MKNSFLIMYQISNNLCRKKSTYTQKSLNSFKIILI